MLTTDTSFLGSFADLRDRAEEAIDFLEAACIPVLPGSRLRVYLKQLESVVKADGIEVPVGFDLAVWHRSLMEVDDLHLIAHTLAKPPEVKGWKEKVVKLGSDLNNQLNAPPLR